VTRAAAPNAAAIVRRAAETLGDRVTTELTCFQVEARTPPCEDISQLRHELRSMRAVVAASAEQEGLRVTATGTPVLGRVVPPPITDDSRYQRGIDAYRALTDEQSICAAHVHVHLPDRERAVLVSNHLRPWLPTLVAMTANSPYWDGRDTGYSSWRTVIWARWPVAGPPPYFESLAHFDAIVSALLIGEVLVDQRTIFWDVRPSHHLPTIEIRVADVPITADESGLLAAVIRALVVVSLEKVDRGDPGPVVSADVLRAAYWRAARDGMRGHGIDVGDGRLRPATELVQALVTHVRPALEHFGDIDFATAALAQMSVAGTGAARQRQAYARRQILGDVVDHLVEATSPVTHRSFRS
jgi:glutamate---cysteine ligase / carboxylate-amine ligase